MVVFIFDKQDQFHFGCGLNEIFIDVQEGNKIIKRCFWQVNDFKSNVQAQQFFHDSSLVIFILLFRNPSFVLFLF